MAYKFQQGPQAGRLFPAVENEYVDPETDAEVRQLTDFSAHSNHVYFTNSGWYDEGRRLLFNSDRDGTHNLYSIDLETGLITQLTDLPSPDFQYRHLSVSAAVNPTTDDVCFWFGNYLQRLETDTLHLETIYEAPDGFNAHTSHASVIADGQYVCTSLTEDVPQTTTAGIWNAEPVTRIMAIPIDGSGEAEVVHEESNWLSHSNTSPTDPNLLTFAQEGPWDQTSQRIWGANRETGEVWKIRPEAPGEEIGHEYWLANGTDIGYHGRTGDGEAFYGITRYDNEGAIEQMLPSDILRYGKKGTQVHFHSHTRDLVVADASPEFPYLLVWELSDDGRSYGPTRKLARHDMSTFDFGRLHVHPRFSPDGSQVLFLSDRSEYANLYLVDVPDIAGLPLATAQ